MRRTARDMRRAITGYPVVVAVIFTELIAQALSLSSEDFRRVAYGYFGTFVQGALVTCAFGQITSESIQHFRQNRIYDNLCASVITRLISGDSIEGDDLRTVFGALPMINQIQSDGWNGLRDFPSNQCAAFILGYQYYGHNISLPGMDASHLTEMAARAAEFAPYRAILLIGGLKRFIPISALRQTCEEIEAKASWRFAVSSKSAEADLRLESHLATISDGRLLIMSTTSQTSGFGYDFVRRHESRLSHVTIAHLSPRLMSHPALLGERAELSVPVAAVPVNQQIADDVADTLRKAIRIVFGLKEIWKLFGDSSINLQLRPITTNHPGVKVRMVSGEYYLQLFPGDLNYAANLYRIGYEITDRELVSRIEGYLEKWLEFNSYRITRTIEADGEAHKALAELGRWLTGVPDIVSRLSGTHNQLAALLPERDARLALQGAMDVLASGLEATQTSDSFSSEFRQHRIYIPDAEVNGAHPRVIISGSHAAHVSAGVVIRVGSRMLIVKKSTSPNVDRWSIPAGHCVWGESAFLAGQRELHEETGILSSELSLVFSGELDEGMACRYGQSVHVWFLYVLQLESIPQLHLERDELSESKWIEVSNLKGIRRKTPAFELLVNRTPAAFGL